MKADAVTSTLCGRVFATKRFSPGLNFVTLAENGRLVSCVHGDLGEYQPRRGDVLIAAGRWRTAPHSAEKEFVFEDILFHKRPAHYSLLEQTALSQRWLECQTAKLDTVKAATSFFQDLDFIQVQSPTIVGNWAEGQTRPFKLEYHGRQDAYLTISTILHHQLIQSAGYGSIFEIARLFRRNNASSRKKLSEFTNAVMSLVNASVDELIETYSLLVRSILSALSASNPQILSLPTAISFERISFRDLLADARVPGISGHQLPHSVRTHLSACFQSFVWITGFPEHTRPFYVKSSDGFGMDCQLWYRGKNYLATGGVIETDPETVARKLRGEGKDLHKFDFYLSALRSGLPPIANIDMGLERFLANTIEDSVASDFAFFPRYAGHLTP